MYAYVAYAKKPIGTDQDGSAYHAGYAGDTPLEALYNLATAIRSEKSDKDNPNE